MAAVDGLRLKVSASEYMNRIGILDAKITELDTILGEYRDLRNDATRVLGDDDDNLNQMRANLDKNINAVQGQRNLLKEQRDMLQKQMENLDMLKSSVGEMFQEGAQAAQNLYKTIKAVGDLTS